MLAWVQNIGSLNYGWRLLIWLLLSFVFFWASSYLQWFGVPFFLCSAVFNLLMAFAFGLLRPKEPILLRPSVFILALILPFAFVVGMILECFAIHGKGCVT